MAEKQEVRCIRCVGWDGMNGTTCDVLPRFCQVWRQIAVAFGNQPPSFEDEVRTASRV